MLHLLGEGGMASVYLAVQTSLDRKVAVKVLRTEGSDDPDRTEQRFLREGKTLAKITHRNVCGIYDLGKVGDLAYIAMEYLDGGTLVDRQQVGIPVAEAIAIVVQLANALQEAHDQGIVHRDLKPANVMMRGGKVPVLTDFGIARELTAHHTKITTENMIIGTPIYMSPEQVSGGEIDGRSDVYSLGVMFYELLVGSAPYKGDMPIQICMQHLTAPVPRLPVELDELNPVMSTMLAKRAEDRYASMIEFIFALRQVLVSSPNLRVKADLMPDQPWTEQLRALGFSLDTLRDVDLRARVNAAVFNTGAQATALPAVKPSPSNSVELAGTAVLSAPRSPTGPGHSTGLDVRKLAADLANSAGTSTRSKSKLWMWLLAGVAALGFVGGSYWYTHREPNKTETLALKALARDFAAKLAADQLFSPEQDNAAQVIADMLEIKRNSKIAKARKQKLWDRVTQKITAFNAGDQFADAETLLEQARSSALFDEEKIREGFDRVADARLQQQRRADLPNLLAAANAGLGTKDLNLDWPSLMRAITMASKADDPSVLALQSKLAAKFAADLEIAITNADLASARLALQHLQLSVPKAQVIESYSGQVAALSASRPATDRIATLAVEIGAMTAQAAVIASARAELESLQAAGSAVESLEADFLKRANEWILPIAKQPARIAETAVLIDALGRYANHESLANLSNAQAESLKAQRDHISMGKVQINALQAASLIGIFDADNNALPLPATTKTPLLLSLPAGVYRLELQSESGQKRAVPAKASRGQTQTVSVDFSTAATIDTDSEEEESE